MSLKGRPTMTQTTDDLTVERWTVVIVDICSSTELMRDLIDSDSEDRWRNLLIGLKNFLTTEEERFPKNETLKIYKFLGDGWILLFPIDFPPVELLSIL